MSDKILIVFEGQRREPSIFEEIRKHYFQASHSIFISIFAGELYQLYEKINEDEYLDIVSILKERNVPNNDLKGIKNRGDVSQVYLFFDHDPQATNYTHDKVKEMLAKFNNETEHGKLYISYPMVESLWHIRTVTDFLGSTWPIASKGYKNKVDLESNPKYKDIRRYEKSTWNFIVALHALKAEKIVNEVTELKDYHHFMSCSQSKIFQKQYEKFINNQNLISILNGFPLFLIEYFGFKLFNEIKNVNLSVEGA